MSDLLQEAFDMLHTKPVTIHIDLARPVQEQLEAEIDALPPCPCHRHSHEMRPVDRRKTIDRAVHDYAELRSSEKITITPHYDVCVQCRLERLGLSPEEARASFDNFLIEPENIRQLWQTCRDFAAAPRGFLLLLGNVGTGKTHLSIAVMRELLRRSKFGVRFIKHRNFVTQHREAQRPVSFRSEQPESPLEACKKAGLLVYDELTATVASGHSNEDVLLDLFETRIGQHKPSIITGNLNPTELEPVLGSRLLDRIRQANYATLQFGFESKRKSLNTDYLNRAVI